MAQATLSDILIETSLNGELTNRCMVVLRTMYMIPNNFIKFYLCVMRGDEKDCHTRLL